MGGGVPAYSVVRATFGIAAQAPSPRSRDAQRQAGRDAAAQAARAADLRRATPSRRWPTRPTRSCSCSASPAERSSRRTAGRSPSRSSSSWSSSSRPTARTCTPTRPAAATTRWRRSTSAPRPASPSRAPCSSTTCSPSRCRSPPACRTPPPSSASCAGNEVIVAVALIAFLTAMNLRGVRESGKAFAVPVYAFMLAIIGMGIYGFIQHFTGTLTPAESAGLTLAAGGGPGPHRARRRLPAAAGLLVRLRGPHRRRGDLQRRAGLQEAQEQQRRDDAAAHGRRSRSSCSGRSSRWPVDRRQDRRRPAAQLLRDGQPVGDAYVQHTAIGQLAESVFADFHARRRLRLDRDRPDPRARRQHRLQRLPGARLDPREGRLPAAPDAHPR